jgi:hypothetical protein
MNTDHVSSTGARALHELPWIIAVVLMVVWCREGHSSEGQVQNLSNQISPLSIVIDYAREGWEQVTPYASGPFG